MSADGQPLLEVVDLQTSLVSAKGLVPAVDGVGFHVRRGEILGLVGESGSGKSMTCLSILRLLPPASARITRGSIRFEGEELLAKSAAQMRALWARVRPITVSEETDLPEPDSPTIPSVWPRSTV